MALRLGTFFKSALAASLVTLFVATAHAQEPQRCAAHEDIISHLGKQFKEKQSAFGTIGNKAIVELFVGTTGSWTIIVTGTDGRTCVLAAGQHWENIPQLAGSEV